MSFSISEKGTEFYNLNVMSINQICCILEIKILINTILHFRKTYRVLQSKCDGAGDTDLVDNEPCVHCAHQFW